MRRSKPGPSRATGRTAGGGPGRTDRPWPVAAVAMVPAAAALLVRLPALRGGWIWDDYVIVHEQLRAFRSPWDLFFPPDGITNFSAHYYRPLTTASYLADRYLFGERAFGFHATLLLAHAAAAALVFLLARTFLKRNREGTLAALLAALVFAVMPIHTESVAWIAGRADVLAAVPLLLAAFMLRSRPLRGQAVAGAAALFAIACLFKEAAYGFVAVAALFSAEGAGPDAGGSAQERPENDDPPPTAERNARTRTKTAMGRAGPSVSVRPVLVAALFAGVAAALLLLRVAALGGVGADLPRQEGAVGTLRSLGGALAFYLSRAVLPLSPRPIVDEIPGGLAAWLGLAAGAGVLALGLDLLARPRARMIGIGLLCFMACLAPSLAPACLRISVVPLAERYLYLPTVGLALVLAGTIVCVPAVFLRRAGLAVLAIAAGLGWISLSRSRLWSDELEFWRAAAASSRSPLARIELATALDDRGAQAEAERIYRDLLAGAGGLDSADRALVKTNLGIMLRGSGRPDEALREFTGAVRLDPSIASAWFGLATGLMEAAAKGPPAGEPDQAVLERAGDAILRAAALSPHDAEISLLLGRIQGALGRTAAARSALLRAAELDPHGEAGEEARRLLARLNH